MSQSAPRLRWAPGPVVRQQLELAGYLSFFIEHQVTDTSLTGVVQLAMIDRLRKDPRFAKGGLHGLHPEVGQHRIDFRAWSGTFGDGSLQVVIDKQTGRCHCDVDRFNPYEDLVNWVGHAYEVVKGWFS